MLSCSLSSGDLVLVAYFALAMISLFLMAKYLPKEDESGPRGDHSG